MAWCDTELILGLSLSIKKISIYSSSAYAEGKRRNGGGRTPTLEGTEWQRKGG